MARRRAKGEGSIYSNEGLNLWIAQITLPNGREEASLPEPKR
jgi:hypothetical protein